MPLTDHKGRAERDEKELIAERVDTGAVHAAYGITWLLRERCGLRAAAQLVSWHIETNSSRSIETLHARAGLARALVRGHLENPVRLCVSVRSTCRGTDEPADGSCERG